MSRKKTYNRFKYYYKNSLFIILLPVYTQSSFKSIKIFTKGVCYNYYLELIKNLITILSNIMLISYVFIKMCFKNTVKFWLMYEIKKIVYIYKNIFKNDSVA